jgi:hypothetical protein
MLGNYCSGSTDAPHSRTKEPKPTQSYQEPRRLVQTHVGVLVPKQLQPPQVNADACRHLCVNIFLRVTQLRQPNQVQCVLLGALSTCAKKWPSKSATSSVEPGATQPFESGCCPFCCVDKRLLHTAEGAAARLGVTVMHRDHMAAAKATLPRVLGLAWRHLPPHTKCSPPHKPSTPQPHTTTLDCQATSTCSGRAKTPEKPPNWDR